MLRRFMRRHDDVGPLDREYAAELEARCSRLERDRSDLIVGLVELIDLLDSSALRHRAMETLAAAGVEAVDSAGDRFDPKRHHAVARLETADAAADGLVAETERLGYVDGDHPVRLPDVLVYRHEGAPDDRA